ncbi:MAG: hypothetical protein H7Y15_03320 [Pseudonocardia sp.]|nr:hypothetical protein [Pseudonocardia sp.]
MADEDGWAHLLAEAMTDLDDCAAYILLVTDKTIDETDAYGPMSATDALGEADRLVRDLDSEGLRGVAVRMVRLHAVASTDDIGVRTAFFRMRP